MVKWWPSFYCTMSLAVVFEPCERICLRKKVVYGKKYGLSHIAKEPQTLTTRPEVSHYQSAAVTAEWQAEEWLGGDQ